MFIFVRNTITDAYAEIFTWSSFNDGIGAGD